LSKHLTAVNGVRRHAATSSLKGVTMSSFKKKNAAKRNVKKAAAAAMSRKTISHLSKATRTALGKQGAKVAKQRTTHT
jgi:hypothetical protein